MKFTYQYTNEEERSRVLDQNSHLILIEEQNITEGSFLIFSDVPLPEPIVYVTVPQEEFESLKLESRLVKAQSTALSERADFVEDVIAEMAERVYK